MRALAALAILAAFLAGCASNSAEPSASVSATSSADAGNAHAGSLASNTTLQRTPIRTIGLNDTGNLGVAAGACVFVVPPDAPVGPCQFPPGAVPGKNDFFLPLAPGDVTTVSTTVTWQAASSATDTFFVGLMVMDECSGCNVTVLQEAVGKSPLTLSWTGKLPVSLAQKVHVYVYNGGPTVVANPAVPAFVYTTTDQQFTVSAQATLESKA